MHTAPRSPLAAVRLQNAQVRAAARKASQARIAEAIGRARDVVATGVCPDCGTALRRNLALAGWWECDARGESRYGRPENAAKPRCAFQCFTE